jgi:hypothetical protein
VNFIWTLCFLENSFVNEFQNSLEYMVLSKEKLTEGIYLFLGNQSYHLAWFSPVLWVDNPVAVIRHRTEPRTFTSDRIN